jgi:hypothetical protein
MVLARLGLSEATTVAWDDTELDFGVDECG